MSNQTSSTATFSPYLELIKKVLTRSSGFGNLYSPILPPKRSALGVAYAAVRAVLGTFELELVQKGGAVVRSEGRDWPADAETMIGLERLSNLEQCVIDVVRDEVPGDLMETGVWRGGATILMRAVLHDLGDRGRTVWVADSFQGLPEPDPGRYPADAGDRLWRAPQLAVPLDTVKANFARYGLLDDQVRFLPGWFHDTLPTAPIEHLAVLRLDGDLYESTMDALRNLYPKLSPGGYVIIDDYGAVPACKVAVDEYRKVEQVSEPLRRIDWSGVFWRKG